MKTGKIVATRPILYEGRQFVTGEELPMYDNKMVDAWLKAGSAKTVDAPVKKTKETQASTREANKKE